MLLFLSMDFLTSRAVKDLSYKYFVIVWQKVFLKVPRFPFFAKSFVLFFSCFGVLTCGLCRLVLRVFGSCFR